MRAATNVTAPPGSAWTDDQYARLRLPGPKFCEPTARQVLGVTPDAPMGEITHAYHWLIRFHGPLPPGTPALAQASRRRLLERIDAAYLDLSVADRLAAATRQIGSRARDARPETPVRWPAVTAFLRDHGTLCLGAGVLSLVFTLIFVLLILFPQATAASLIFVISFLLGLGYVINIVMSVADEQSH